MATKIQQVTNNFPGFTAGYADVPNISIPIGKDSASGTVNLGNLNDKNSRMSKIRGTEGNVAHPRDYRLFDYIGIKPRVSYLARVMNPNHKMPDVPKDWAGAHKEGGHA